MNRVSRRIVAIMILAGGLLTVLSFVMHVGVGRMTSGFDRLVAPALTVIGHLGTHRTDSSAPLAR
jgi:hypothetical protein